MLYGRQSSAVFRFLPEVTAPYVMLDVIEYLAEGLALVECRPRVADKLHLHAALPENKLLTS